MTITENTTATTNPFETVAVDFYRDIHKAIRSELFAVTSQAGSSDPGSRQARQDVADHVRSLFSLLEGHAQHEDDFLQPVIQIHTPRLAGKIVYEHSVLESRMVDLQARADDAVTAPGAEQRGRVHALYLGMASFTSMYLAHQEYEERVVMPALAEVIGTEELAAIEQALIASIPPDEVATGLALMIPAMNVDDRVELLGGMQAGAPPEVFAGVWALAGSVLTPTDTQAVATRLGIA